MGLQSDRIERCTLTLQVLHELEQALALQAWIGLPVPVMGWRVIDQFARVLGGDAPAVGFLPSQLLTITNVADAALDENGNYIGIANYKELFAQLWGVN